MNVTIKCFAALREQAGFSEQVVELQSGDNAAGVWQRVCDLPLDPHILVAINKQYAQLSSPVSDGDEVAFFPPVTGG
ncbi:MAG: molybdopterin synthase sulfur carrier subunit [Parasphingorhabdus sp.]|jgi:molybdopterin synthase sulfur carrier subunit